MLYIILCVHAGTIFFSSVGVVSTTYYNVHRIPVFFLSVAKRPVLREELSDRVFQWANHVHPASLVSDALPTQTHPCPENRRDQCPTTSIFYPAPSWAVSISPFRLWPLQKE